MASFLHLVLGLQTPSNTTVVRVLAEAWVASWIYSHLASLQWTALATGFLSYPFASFTAHTVYSPLYYLATAYESAP